MTEPRKAAKPTVQIENERVIVTEWRFGPGAETKWHRHEYDILVVPLTTGKLLIETKTGESVSELVTGQSYGSYPHPGRRRKYHRKGRLRRSLFFWRLLYQRHRCCP